MNYLLGAIDKFDEASFFCRHVKNDPHNVHHYVNAFAGATFAVWECLAKLCQPRATKSEKCPACGGTRTVLPDDDEAWNWFKKTKKEATKSPIGRYFHDGRSADVHAGVGFVDGWSVILWVDAGGEIQGDNTPLLRDAGVAGFPAGVSPANGCESYLASLVRIFAAGYGQFSSTWDQAEELKHEVERLRREWAEKVQ